MCENVDIVINALNYTRITDEAMFDAIVGYTKELRKSPKTMNIKPTEALRCFILEYMPCETEKLKRERQSKSIAV
jgi:hypothetical protein